ncbi:MAG: DUF2080 family transposase-associated protein [Theionarchaea archaeon]|nr:DUF2080 family transposase-associated protein [Theionarchaea archaeon]
MPIPFLLTTYNLSNKVQIIKTSFGNSAKVGAPKEYIGRRTYVIIRKELK